MKLVDIFIAVMVMAIWGVNFSIIKLGLFTVDPFVLAGIRFLLCALPLVFFVKRPDTPLRYIIAYGLFFCVGLWGLVNLGIYFGISAGVASLALQLSAFFTILLGYFILGESIDIYKKIGCLIAFLGLGVIFFVTDGSVTYMGLLFVVLGALSWSVGNVIVKKSGTKQMFSFVIWSSLFAPMPLFILAYLTHGAEVFTQLTSNANATAVFSILFQAYPTTLLGYWVWNALMHKYPASTVAPLSLLVPVFGLLGSYVIFDEAITCFKLLAMALIILGLTLNIFGIRLGNRFFHKNEQLPCSK